MNEPAITVAELQAQVHAFAEETFGPEREDAAWKKLFEEIGETLKNPDDPSEWADVFIILLDLAKIHGVDVGTASVAKMLVNRERVWTKTSTGVMQHVPGKVRDPEVEAPQLYYHRAAFQGGPWANVDGFHHADSTPPDALWVPGHPVFFYLYSFTNHSIGAKDPIRHYFWTDRHPG